MQEVGNKEEAARAGRRHPAFEQGGDVVLDVMAGDDAGARLAGPIEDGDLLWGEEARWERRGGYLFFLDRP